MKSNSSTPEVRPWTSKQLDPQNVLWDSRGDALLFTTTFRRALFASIRISIFKSFFKFVFSLNVHCCFEPENNSWQNGQQSGKGINCAF